VRWRPKTKAHPTVDLQFGAEGHVVRARRQKCLHYHISPLPWPPQSPALGLLSPVEQVTHKKIPLPCPQIPLSSAVAEKGQAV
jgi:hypothetical protein